MSQVFFEEMEIPRPAVNLQVGSGRHGEATGAMLAGIEREILARKPDRLLVYGDTNSTLAGALAAAKLHVPIVHVEAGLRSYNRRMPEEINRVLVDHVSSVLFCPSEQARANLAREGIERGVHVVGDVMYDAVRYYRGKAIAPPVSPPFILCTLHRAENTDDGARLRGILAALQERRCRSSCLFTPGRGNWPAARASPRRPHPPAGTGLLFRHARVYRALASSS